MGRASSIRACNAANRAFDRANVDVTPPFSAADDATWPVLLTLQQIASIWQRQPAGIAKSCQVGRFIPAPFSKQPYRWRRADVLRVLQERRGTSLRRVG